MGKVEATGPGDALMTGHYSYTHLLNNRQSWRAAQGSMPLLLGLAVEHTLQSTSLRCFASHGRHAIKPPTTYLGYQSRPTRAQLTTVTVISRNQEKNQNGKRQEYFPTIRVVVLGMHLHVLIWRESTIRLQRKHKSCRLTSNSCMDQASAQSWRPLMSHQKPFDQCTARATLLLFRIPRRHTHVTYAISTSHNPSASRALLFPFPFSVAPHPARTPGRCPRTPLIPCCPRESKRS